jgi:serine/threonine protein kinase
MGRVTTASHFRIPHSALLPGRALIWDSLDGIHPAKRGATLDSDPGSSISGFQRLSPDWGQVRLNPLIQKRFTPREKQHIICKQNPRACLSRNHLNRSWVPDRDLHLSQKNKRPWSRNWTIIEELPGGGQSETFVVEQVQSGQRGVLKKLRRQDDPERRGRMHREVKTLQTLNHEGIPRLIESNSAAYKSDAILYLITEYVEGVSLENSITNGAMPLGDAQRLLLGLLEILNYTHSKGIVHRDIKPDNIILRGARSNDPVLIDFGLSFNETEQSETILTDSHQQLGNRFLVLPELQLRSSLQRDARSDLTQCVGVLFYSLTRVHPVTLTDQASRLPHQRDDVQHCWESIPTPIRQRLLRVFDRGFTRTIDQRWQSANELHAALAAVTSADQERTYADQIELSEIVSSLSKTQEFSRRQRIQGHVDNLRGAIKDTVRSLVKQLGSEFGMTVGGRAIDWQKLTFDVRVGVYHNLSLIIFIPRFEGRVTGNEVIVSSDASGAYEEFIRFPINGEPDFQQFRERLAEFYNREISKRIEAVS